MRKNINRGYMGLIVWNDAVEIYVLAVKILSKFSYLHSKSSANAIDAALSISRNIAEGYCRKSIKEYLNFLNISLGSCGEFASTFFAFHKAGLISDDDFEEFDSLHYKLENTLIRLIQSIQEEKKKEEWDDTFVKKD